MIDTEGGARLAAGMDGLKARAETIEQLADSALFYVRERPLPMDEKAAKQLTAEARKLLFDLGNEIDAAAWDAPSLEALVRGFAEKRQVKLGQVAQPLRAALTGSSISPGIFEVMAILGRAEAVGRIRDVAHSDR